MESVASKLIQGFSPFASRRADSPATLAETSCLGSQAHKNFARDINSRLLRDLIWFMHLVLCVGVQGFTFRVAVEVADANFDGSVGFRV